ncbi:MAG: bifunctional demethylmenaquinone methyltransferase/2-methoxy-6-polyprenyl-1,4-benzoquinol methylase UbiE [Gammaproteobacteria bacterium]|nr:bifunctional demethylmenaquinone methyltransferase/2-methoxy-6-polyprenyl-1,4-benzoquinol methylase UbiE [Gammaproteobacteria bacterium]MCY4357285.1 bifunctional demethylmenaquinone methyltransferase/2-methoxy-6-polyprenyl-1,4-benzoquinol methylase UbiE [Gammaproteobacteria bacterium]
MNKSKPGEPLTGDNQDTTHFGFEQVPVGEKQARVAAVFRSVARRYDLMNDLMSLGTHRLIKHMTINLCALRPGHSVLDLAGGTGDLSMKMAPLVGKKGTVVLADINNSMLQIGRDRLIDRGLSAPITLARINAEALPFADDYFDCICIAYGLRNVTDKQQALFSMLRVLKPGGRAVVLEFSTPKNPLLSKAYQVYSDLWPLAGKLVTGDSDSYRYLVESIRMHPDQKTLLDMMKDAGFANCRYHDVMDGICAIHIGHKPWGQGA